MPRAFQKGVGNATSAVIDYCAREAFLDNFDMVHVHDARIAVAIRQGLFKLVFTCHTPNQWASINRYQNWRGQIAKLKLRVTELFGKHDLNAINCVDATVVLGPHLTKAIKVIRPRLFEKAEICVIPNGTNAYKWRATTNKQDREVEESPDEKFNLVYVGRVDPTKGAKFFASSFASAVR